jgi:hypothetical protein
MAAWLPITRSLLLDSSIDAFILSFPKCGRTWVRLMIGQAIASHFNIPTENPLDLYGLSADPRVPKINIRHEGDPGESQGRDLSTSRAEFRDKTVIVLVRDPRDVVVSQFFHSKNRTKNFTGDISEFLRHSIGSLDSLLTYYNIWGDEFGKLNRGLLVHYEDLIVDSAVGLRRILDHVGLGQIDQATVESAAEFASFQNMRRMEEANALGSSKLSSKNLGDHEHFKTRRGQVGAYVEYFTATDLDYLNSAIFERLPKVLERYRKPA